MSPELLRTCRELFSPGERVVCAVSGGADSMALLWYLNSVRSELSISLVAAHFNHRLRDDEADRDECFVRSFCEKHNIPLHIGSGNVAAHAQAHGLSTEEAARELRYAFLQALPYDKIAVAHTADDNAETVLMHLLRGSGLRGLCGIAPQRKNIVRPLLGVSRAQIEIYLHAEGIPWVEDSSNASAAYTRNRLRHELLPLMKRENPNLLNALNAHCAVLRAEDALLDTYAQAVVEAAREGERYRCAPILSAPDALQKRALRLIMREYLPQDLSLVHITAMQELLRSDSPSAQRSLPQQLHVRRCYDLFEIAYTAAPKSFSPVTLQIPGESVAAELGLKFSCEIIKNLQLFLNSAFQFAVKYDMIAQHDVIVRPRKAGDKLTLSCSKTLKKWCIDRKIPLRERDRLPVFSCGDQVIAVPGLGVDRSFLPRQGDTILLISIEKMPDSGESAYKGAIP